MYTLSYIDKLPIIEIDNFITHQESDVLLASRVELFEKANSHYPSYYRDNDRYIEDTPILAHELFLKLKNHDFKNRGLLSDIVGLNQRIRFCRYQKGQSFSVHQDGVYYPNDSQATKYTFLLYLNDDFNGGATSFYKLKSDTITSKSIQPKKGKLVIFDHRIWHKGDLILEGDKYILRSDIIVDATLSKAHHQGYIWSLTQCDDTTFISCGRDTYIKLWNTNLELLNAFKIHTKSVIKVIQVDTNTFISCSRDFTLKKWNRQGKVLASVRFREMIIALHKGANDIIIAAGTSGTLYYITKELVMTHSLKVHDNWIWDLALLPDHRVISSCEDGTIHITNVTTQVSECVYAYGKPLFCMHLHNTILYVGAKDGVVLKICLITLQAEKNKIHQDAIRAILLKDEINLFTCGEDNRVITTDIHSHISQEYSKSSNFIQDILIINDALFTAGYDGNITKKSLKPITINDIKHFTQNQSSPII